MEAGVDPGSARGPAAHGPGCAEVEVELTAGEKSAPRLKSHSEIQAARHEVPAKPDAIDSDPGTGEGARPPCPEPLHGGHTCGQGHTSVRHQLCMGVRAVLCYPRSILHMSAVMHVCGNALREPLPHAHARTAIHSRDIAVDQHRGSCESVRRVSWGRSPSQ